MEGKKNQSVNIGTILQYWFMPFWPIFVLFIVLFGALGSFYIYTSLPSYEATATLMIKDEKKGYDDSRMVEMLNIYSAKKIVENEIEVIKSRSLVKAVVNNLKLYAPIYRKNGISTFSAYLESPISVEVKDIENIIDHKKIFFTYDHMSGKVKIDGKLYEKDKWVGTKYGVIKFTRNMKFVSQTSDPLFFNLIPLRDITTNLISRLNIFAINKLSSVVAIKIKDEVPQKAEDILNELIQEYNKAGLNDKNTLASNTLSFVDDRLSHVAIELDSIERQVEAYRSTKGAVNLSEQSVNYLNNLGDNDQKISVMRMNMAVLDEVEKSVANGRGKKSIIPSTLGVDDPLLTQMLNRLYTAESEYNKLKNTTAENNPLLASLANEIEQIRPKILENIRVERLSIKTGLTNLEKTNAQYTNRLSTIPEKERELLEISRHQATINSVYNFLLQKREETALSQASTMSDLRVIDMAEADFRQSNLKKLIVLVGIVFLALIFTVAIIIYQDVLSNKVLFRTTIENNTNVPIISEMPLIDKSHLGSNNLVAEQFRQLAINLHLTNESACTILVCSSIEGEGKGYVSNNLAQCLSLIGKRTLLIDLDLNSSKITTTFELNNKLGLADFLANKCAISEIIYSTNNQNLSLMPTGVLKSNSTDLLLGNRLTEIFEYAKANFDQIIVTSSPLELVADAGIIAQYCDKSIIVVRHGYTPDAMLKAMDTKLEIRNIKNSVMVFNGVKHRGVFRKNFGYLHYGYGTENIYLS